MKGMEPIDIDMDKMRSQIGANKGIGERRLNQIMDIIAEHLNIKKEELKGCYQKSTALHLE